MDCITNFLSQMDVKLVVLTLSAAAAIFSIRRNTVINCRRATVDLVLHQRSDIDLKAANRIVNPLLKQNKITKYADEEHKNSDQTKAIFAVINNYEFIAAGIKESAFDLKLYQRMNHGTVVRDWDSFKAFIYAVRQDRSHNTLFQEFEWLAMTFKDKPLKVNKKDQ